MRDRAEYGGAILVLLILSFGGALLIAAMVGLWAWLLVGVITVALGATALLLWSRRHDRAPPPDPVPEPPRDGIRRIVVVVDEACDPRALYTAVSPPAKVLVVAPASGSRLDRWTSDEHGYAGARERVDTCIAALADLGITADGHVGSHDLIQATDEALRELPADELIFASAGAADAARARYRIPVTHLAKGDPT